MSPLKLRSRFIITGLLYISNEHLLDNVYLQPRGVQLL